MKGTQLLLLLATLCTLYIAVSADAKPCWLCGVCDPDENKFCDKCQLLEEFVDLKLGSSNSADAVSFDDGQDGWSFSRTNIGVDEGKIEIHGNSYDSSAGAGVGNFLMTVIHIKDGKPVKEAWYIDGVDECVAKLSYEPNLSSVYANARVYKRGFQSP